ncbi:MAG: hypothetical protein JWN10_2039 [Solirubrobacterales bacterium]|nr:hypothetical protein [Solirubrobacterales bacterium]
MSVAGPADELPYIDAHTIEVQAPVGRVWDQIVESTLRDFGAGMGPLGPYATRLSGCPYVEPPSPGRDVPETIVGFRVARAEQPSLIVLAGKHRFARYSLTLRIDPVGDGRASRLTAETRAIFPGAAGRAYKRIVIGTGGHVIVVMRMLRSIRQRVECGVSPI